MEAPSDAAGSGSQELLGNLLRGLCPCRTPAGLPGAPLCAGRFFQCLLPTPGLPPTATPKSFSYSKGNLLPESYGRSRCLGALSAPTLGE